MILAFTTVMFPTQVWLNVAVYIYTSLFGLGFLLTDKPMSEPVLNYIENVNEFIIYTTGFFMLIFSAWFPNRELQYEIGFLWYYYIIAFIGLNISLIIWSIVK
jgi:hypothetical protein